MKIFTPFESMNPVFIGTDESLFERIMQEHNDATLAEIKEDGYRMQVHKQGSKIKAYTRQMKEIILEIMPELRASLLNLPDCIMDAELIGQDKVGHAGFKVVQRRFRHRISQKGIEEYLESGLVEDMPLALRVFDTLYWEGSPLIDQPLTERRTYTESIDEKLIAPSTQRLITDSTQLRHWFDIG